ncbi:MAG: hypothetical protein ACE5Q6_06230 [Dehalococcoidia bacterium]
MRTAMIGFIGTVIIGLGVMGGLMWNLHNERTQSPEPPHELKSLAAERADFHGSGFFKKSTD